MRIFENMRVAAADAAELLDASGYARGGLPQAQLLDRHRPPDLEG
jgi:hypothetical protein